MSMSKCIYCPAEADSVEHHLPRALGNFKGYVPLLDRVCSACNGKLGLLDEQLCRSGIEAFFRTHLEIDGRKQHPGVHRSLLAALGFVQEVQRGQTGDLISLPAVGN
jgi:hypothetical protein